MIYRRFGTFRFRDCFAMWIGGLILLLFGIILLINCYFNSEIQLSLFISAFMIIESFVWIFFVMLNYNEKFRIYEKTILCKKGLKTSSIDIPAEYVIIIGYADMHERFGTQSYIFNGKYSASLIRFMPFEDALKHLHSNHIKKYSNSAVETMFGHDYLYSFVITHGVLKDLLHQCRYLIVPKSIYGKIDIDLTATTICVDEGY